MIQNAADKIGHWRPAKDIITQVKHDYDVTVLNPLVWKVLGPQKIRNMENLNPNVVRKAKSLLGDCGDDPLFCIHIIKAVTAHG